MSLTPFRWGCALVTALLGTVALAQSPPMPTPPPTPNVAATVNGEVIRLDQVDAIIRRQPSAAAPLTSGQARRLRQEIVEDLIDDTLLRQFLRQHGPKVDPAETEKHFRALAISLQRRGQSLADFYRETGQTEAQVRETWATLFQFQKYVDTQASPEQLKKYHEANRDFFDGVTVRVRHIVLRVSPGDPPGERAAAHQKLASLRADILAGKVSFPDAARRHSICPTAPQGGEIGWIGRRDAVMDEPFLRTAFALKVHDVSEPTDTEFGVHLLQVTERKPGTPSTFDKVADLVRECYAEEIRQGLIARLRKEATIQVTIPE